MSDQLHHGDRRLDRDLHGSSAVAAGASPVGASPAGRNLAGRILVGRNGEGVVEVQLPPQREIDGSDARAADVSIRELSGGRQIPLLLVVTGALGITGEGRQQLTDVLAASASALAVVGESPVDRVIAHSLLRPKIGLVQGRFFTTGAEAVEWLGQQTNDD